MLKFKINNRIISEKHRTYFIADIAANHDGSISRAKKLIKLAAKNGADAAKFQHFKAETIVNKNQFDKMPKLSHQSTWEDSVFEVYKKASINTKWNEELLQECKKNKIDYMTAPYDLNYVDQLKKYICAYKIGSGEKKINQLF
jgi:N-acetylneuraminate synthase